MSRNAVPEVIEAAYRALARLRHPDATDEPDADSAMAELNWAYAVLREPDLKASYDSPGADPGRVEPPAAQWTEPSLQRAGGAWRPRPPSRRDATNPANTTLDFGRYAGMTLRQIARVEPSYLEWLTTPLVRPPLPAARSTWCSDSLASARPPQPSSG